MEMRRTAAGALAAALALPALGQQQIEEILVTARKREESIMKVPVVANVLGEAQLLRYETGDLYQITERIPSLNFSTGTLSFGAQISLRGVGTGSLVTTIDQSVSLNIDGMQMTQGLAYAAGTFDMARVEVLKGPQALFFGKASPGGVIAITTADPGEERELIVRQGYEFEAEEKRTELILSGPVSDTLGVRLAGRFSEAEGFMDNRARPVGGDTAESLAARYGTQIPDGEFPHREEWLWRATALWQPSDAFRARLKVNLTEFQSADDGGLSQFASCPDGTGSPAGVPYFHPEEDCKFDKTIRVVWFDPAALSVPGTGMHGTGVRNGGVPFQKVEQRFGTLELHWDFAPQWNLTSVTGFYDLDQSSMINGTLGGYAPSLLAADPDFEKRDFTQEVRLSSAFADRPYDVVLGAFYQDGEMVYHNNLLINTAQYDEVEAVFGLPAGFGAVLFPPQFNRGVQPIDVETRSLFGQLLWRPAPDLELTAGVRWTDEKRTHRVYSTNPYFVPAFAGIAPAAPGERVPVATAVPKLSGDDWAPELTATWTPSEDLTLFASLKRAHKSGSFDTVTIKNPGSDVSFGDEKVEGGELGIKARLDEGRAQVNLAGYYYEFEDLQTGANEVREDGIIQIRTINAASATIQGVDLDFTWLPEWAPNLNLYGALNYNLAEYDEFDTAPCWGGQRIQDGCNRLFNPATGAFSAQDLSGEKLLRAPEWSGHLGFDLTFPARRGVELELGGYLSYSDRYLTNVLARADMWQDDYLTYNGHFTVRAANGGWELTLIGNNLTDEIVAGNCVNANFANGNFFGGVVSGREVRGPAGVEELICDVANRRSVWLRLTLRWPQLAP
ncbi:MAG: TonB-dependent receptor [Porticoccaceae bacterium]|nr:MAG: TonB-dependent receptor [Porticoccaceae bacterium]